MKKTAYRKDITRTIKHGKKRFISILIIVALGVIMSAGLRAACVDLRLSADKFMDEQNLYDIVIQSTLGLTDEDVEALCALSGVGSAAGGYSETVYLTDEAHKSVTVKTICAEGINEPYLIEGTLPEEANEIAVTESYLEENEKQIGDTLTIEEIEDDEDDEDSSDEEDGDEDAGEDDESSFYYTEFVITAVVQDPANINNPDSATSFRDTSTTDYTFFVAESAVNSDIYTAVYIIVSGASELSCYSDEYSALVSSVMDDIEAKIKSDREQARTEEVISDAGEEIDEAEEEMNEAFEEADEEIAEAEEELADARQQLDDGWAEYYDGLAQLEDAQAELDEGIQTLKDEEESAWAQIDEAWEEIEAGWAEIEEGKAEISAAWEEIETGLAEIEAASEEIEAGWAEVEENEALIEENIAQVEEALSLLSAVPEGYDETIDAQREALQASLSELEAALEEIEAAKQTLEESQTQLDAALEELEAGAAELEAAEEELEAGEAELEAAEALLKEQEETAAAQFAAAWEEIEEAQAEIDEAYAELEDGLKELEEGEEEYADGLAEFEESISEYEEEKADAESEIADARSELDDIDAATWYVQDRSSLSGYANIDSDSGAIEAIGNYFPVIFLAVAVLISLTTITRMVEEERGLIGTYKALGFTNSEIRRKYIVYSLSACLAGSLIGEAGGFIALPAIVFIIFGVMYSLPSYMFTFDLLYGLLGPAVFFAAVGFATWFACRRALSQKPAALMRPKAPRPGTKVFLERIGPLWRRLSFLNKVTARNLFRYKKRLFMTVVGIAGCTGILILGFAIKNSVSELVTLQYEETYKYDLMAVATDNDELLEYMDSTDDIDEYLNVRIDSVTVTYDDSKMSVQIMVVPDEYADELTKYIHLETTDGEEISLEAGDILITRNVGQVLGYSAGDTVSIQDLTLAQADTEVTAQIKNYLGNYVFVAESTYEEIFEEEYEANAVLANFAETVEDHTAWAEELSQEDSVTSAIATQQLKDEFSAAFLLMDMVFYIIVIMAAALAFVVLFTLSTTNISEREREIATIKVLGFHDKEVHLYVNKEMMLLTIMGIIPGLVLGYFLSHGMTAILKMPSLYFAVTIYPVSFILAVVLTIVFALIVQLITNKVLNKVDPVEALKSIE